MTLGSADSAANQDEGTILSILGIQNDTALLSAITSENTTSYTMNAAAFPALLAAYPNDPRLGAPQGTGRGVLASGAQDKRVSYRTLCDGSYPLLIDSEQHYVR